MIKDKVSQFEGASALLASAFLYGTMGILIREISKMMGDAMQTFARFALVAVIITVFNLVIRKRFRVSRLVLLRASLLGVLFAAEIVLFTIAANNTKIANATFLLYAGSIMSAFVIGTLAFKEKVTLQKVIAILIALAGLSMYSGALAALSIGIVAAIASGLLDGMANAVRKTLKGVDRKIVIMYQFGAGSIFGLGVVAATGDFGIGAVTFWPVAALLVFALIQIVLNHLLLFGFQHFDVNIGTVILAMELFFASILAYLFLHETPTSQELFGGILIFIASIFASVNFAQLLRRPARKPRPAA